VAAVHAHAFLVIHRHAHSHRTSVRTNGQHTATPGVLHTNSSNTSVERKPGVFTGKARAGPFNANRLAFKAGKSVAAHSTGPARRFGCQPPRGSGSRPPRGGNVQRCSPSQKGAFCGFPQSKKKRRKPLRNGIKETGCSAARPFCAAARSSAGSDGAQPTRLAFTPETNDLAG